ncbi:Crp/Fnr family transcriptional regulator [Aquabacterium sp. A7-Y]|uniref:Crp/Fnr family transcriptional regulator n=1 Tax=Aquabacterium sp. A7-Y TaxID=1349605 RepID=UPI00223DEB8A|nr:Crp/Fnr family transcriptional regulator [Aquabacterium sp. A7-Y]MCW7538654.1 Crp/Fnr family transcriptional regulator [Aquabacterium sp. A7-Y]
MPAAATDAGVQATLRQGRWFAQLSPEFQAGLLEHALLRRLVPGERLFLRGDPPCGLYAVLEGAMRISGVSGVTGACDLGKEALLAMVEPPSWFGEIAVFDGQPRTHDAVADAATWLLQVPQGALLALLEVRPAFWRELGGLLCHKLRLAFVTLEDMALLPAPTRLARRLLRIAEGEEAQSVAPAAAGPRAIRLSQQQLSRMLSLTRQTTNQILRELQKQGIVRIDRGRIEVLDLRRLGDWPSSPGG